MGDIEVERITKCFGSFCAVNELSFSVEHGEVFGLLGPNGAGKSTLIRMLTTLFPPTSGSARVNGFDVANQAYQVRQSIGVIPQAMTSDSDLSAEENMIIFAKLYGVPRERRKRVTKELLQAVDLEQWMDKPVKQFSGGMRRRLEIARGLVHEPKIFFLDEPTTGLDPASRVAVWEMLSRLKKEHDLTILLTTHYMDEADKLCDRIAIVDHGKLVALDSPLKLKASIPGTNILEVSFSRTPEGWSQTLENLPEVASVKTQDHVFRISSHNGPRTMVELVEAARRAQVEVTSLSVQSTTLDDVFMHYTGHQLRDSLQSAVAFDSSFMYQRGQRP
ncbi:MAG TPA: ATP-binding cassette domain-containing protein [Terriglobia bacterium]|jgi:ABC-2 type transport system ATP-binding protein|nr:ATP-binding cassette domain-containing protein [Terriglobia bacterium]